MKILLIHNSYKQKGGEDAVFKNEFNLLKSLGFKVDKLLFSNLCIKSAKDQILTGIYSIYNYKSAKLLEDRIKTFKPDIIHIHNWFPLASPSIILTAKKQNIPVVMTLHNFRLICPNALLFRNGKICEKCIDKFFPYPAIFNKCYRNSYLQTLSVSLVTFTHKVFQTWQKIDKFIALTEFQKNKFLSSSLKIPKEKISVKPNFTKDFGMGFNKRENFFLYVGRLSEEKGIDTLLEAFKNTQFVIKIIGDGNLKHFILKHSQKYKNIIFLGYKNKNEVIQYMKKAKALIFPSKCYEGFPTVLVEALSVGTPVITSNIGSQAEIIKDGYNGLHFKVNNELDLRSKLVKFLSSKNKKFYENARKEYLDKYTPEKNIQILTKIYGEVINATKKAGY